MTRVGAQLALLALLVVGTAAAASAAGQARCYGVVSDENGTPVPGVAITVTDPTVVSFRLESSTDTDGRYAVVLVDATRPYLYRFDKEGYQPLEATVKIPFNSNTERNFTLLSLGAAGAQDAASAAGIELFNEGVAAIEAGDPALAEEKFLAAAAEAPELARVRAALAALYLQGERFGEAAAAAEKAVELEPGNAAALETRYKAYKGMGDEEQAATALEAWRVGDPEHATGATLRTAKELYNTGRMAEAAKAFAEVVAVEPANAEAHYLLGLCAVSTGDSARARTALETFLELAPDHPDAATAKDMLSYLP